VSGCVELLAGRPADGELVFAIGGPAARSVLDGGQQYWLRVWAMRALLYVWDDTARRAVQAGLADESWRVREMAAKVVARRHLGDTLAVLAELRHDPVARVRAAAARALTVLTAAQA
jgi:HEAT repeat protein